MKDMKVKNQEKVTSKSLNSNNSKSMSSWERRKLYSKQMYQKRRVSKDSELKEISNPINKFPDQEKIEEKFEKIPKIQKRKFSVVSLTNENNKENITATEENNDCPVPNKLQRRESFTVCKGISPIIMKNKQVRLTEELIMETNKSDFDHFENKTSKLNCNTSCTNLSEDKNELGNKKQKLANIISKNNKANNSKIEKCNQKSDLFKHPPKPGSGATSSVNMLNNNQNKKEASFIITEKKLSRKEQLIKWRKEREERKCNLQKRRTICPIVSENSCLNDPLSLFNLKEIENSKSIKPNSNLKITDFKEKDNKILKNKDSIAVTKEKRFTLASNDLQKIEAARKKNYKNFNSRQSIAATKEKRFTMASNDLQKIENSKRIKCDEIKKSRQSIAVTKERRVTMPSSHLHKIDNIKRKKDDNKLMLGRKSIAVTHKTSITINNTLKNKKASLTKIKNSAELQCKQIPSNGKIKSSALSSKEDIKKKENNIITTANINQTRRSISSLFRAGQLEKVKNNKNVSICLENRVPENEMPKSIIKGKSSRKKSVCFNVTSDFGTSGRKLPKTPKRQLTMRENLESWLDNEGHNLSDFHNILCFGHHFSDFKLKKFSKVKFDNHPDSLGGSPLLKVRNSSDKNDLSVSDTYDVDKVLLELKKLLEIGYPSSKLTEWLHDIAKCIPEIEKKPQYWICHSLAAEKENKLEEALSFYHTALDKGVEAAEISQEFERLLCSYSAQNENKWQSQKVAKISDKTKVNTPRKPLVDNGNIFQSTMIMFDLSLTGSQHYKSPAKVVATPVRRSARLCRTPCSVKEKSLCIEDISKLPYDLKNHMLLKENNALPKF